MLPTLTVVKGVNPRPVIVTLVPGLPEVGVNEIICRLIEVTPELHAVKPAFVTEIFPEVAFIDKVAWMVVALMTVKLVMEMLPILTALVPIKLFPEIVIEAPALAIVGTLDMEGGFTTVRIDPL